MNGKGSRSYFSSTLLEYPIPLSVLPLRVPLTPEGAPWAPSEFLWADFPIFTLSVGQSVDVTINFSSIKPPIKVKTDICRILASRGPHNL